MLFVSLVLREVSDETLDLRVLILETVINHRLYISRKKVIQMACRKSNRAGRYLILKSTVILNFLTESKVSFPFSRKNEKCHHTHTAAHQKPTTLLLAERKIENRDPDHPVLF